MTLQQPQLLHIALNEKDVVYTPDWAARDMVEFFKPTGRILEPCKGDGVFLKYLPAHTEWCEIEQGRDFYQWAEPVDWLVGNPPYSKFYEWLSHSMSVAQNIVYLLPAGKPMHSWRIYELYQKWGNIKHLRLYGNGRKLGFELGFAVGAVHFQRGYFGPMYISYYK